MSEENITVGLKDEELEKVTGGTVVCGFSNGNIYNFEIGHYYLSQLKTSIIKVVGTAQYEENSNRYSIPIELYSLQKQFLSNAYLSVKESDPPFEEVSNF